MLAEYGYNGLGWRTWWHKNTNGSSATDTGDPQFHAYFDNQWRQIGTRR